MKKSVLLITIIMLFGWYSYSQFILELDPSTSMCITGKGPGQDGAINPYPKTDSYAIVKNIGKNAISIRIQKEGKILKEITVKPKVTKKVELLKGYEMYFDNELKARVKVDFKPKKS
jgi:hypothetical protein